MATALLIVTAVVVCVPVQLLVPGRWFSLFLSIVAIMIAWVLVSLMFAFVTTHPHFGTGEWAHFEAVLGAALIAQIVSVFLRRFR
jgi:hypothetical protein